MREAVALFLPSYLSVQECISAVRYADVRGFEAVWQAENTYVRDPFVLMGLYAGVTQRIRLGVGPVHHATRSLPALSASLMTLDDAASRRILCAFDPWNDAEAARAGMPRPKPLLAMREAIQGLRRLVALEQVTLMGETRQLLEVQIRPLERPEPRIFSFLISGTGAFHALAGEIADGVLLNSMVSPDYTAHAVAETRIGLTKARRDPSDFMVAQLILCSVPSAHETLQDAWQRARHIVTMAMLKQPDSMRAAGVPQSLISDVLQSVRHDGGAETLSEATCALVSDDIIRLIVAVGSERAVRARVREYVQAGATLPVLVPLGHDVRALVDAFAQGYHEPQNSFAGIKPS